MARILMLLALLYSPLALALDPVKQAEDLRRPEDPALLNAAESADPLARAQAAQAWGRIQKPVSIDRLFALLGDVDASVRQAAVFALGQYGWKAEFSQGREAEILSKIAPSFQDTDAGVRLAAIEAAGKIGLDQAPTAVEPFLGSTLETERAEALMAIYRYRLVYRLRQPTTVLPDLPKMTLDAMLALSNDSSALVRRNLVYYFARVKDARGLPVVLQLSADPDVWVRYFAIVALGKTADPQGTAAAVRATGEENYILRVAAVQALAALGKTAEIPPALLQDPTFHVRAAIADATGADATAPIDVLSALSLDNSTTVQAEALGAKASRMKIDALQDLKNALASPAYPVRRAAYDALGTLAPDAGAAALALQGTTDPDPRAAYAAIAAIASIPGDDSWRAIQSALESSEPAIRGAAVEALTSRKDTDVAQVAWRAFSLMPEDHWIDARTGIIQAIAAIPGDETTQDLKSALVDPALEVVTAAVKALADRGQAVPMPDRLPTLSPYRDRVFARNPTVILETTQGQVTIECFPSQAPIHVATFVSLAEAGRYNGTAFHRVVSDFVVQGGTFDGSGYDNGDFSIRAEVNGVRFDRGTVGMPRADDFDTGSVELFITHVPTPHLDGQYTVFGQVTSGIEAVDKMEVGDVILAARVIE
jgi:cyclophilin family peptidyl-prolyl cis-trans isomerase/HEAT repeat protein